MLKIMSVFALLLGVCPAFAGWDNSEIEDKLTGAKSPAMILDATETQVAPVGFPAHNRNTAFLMLSCSAQKAALLVFVGGRTTARKGTSVSYRLDKDPPTLKAAWQPSQSGEGIGVFDRKSALPLMDKFSKASTLFVRIEDQIFGTTEATFNLEGINDSLKPLREQCRF